MTRWTLSSPSHEDVVCPNCGKHNFTAIRKFNLMFKTQIGVTEDTASTCYLRPETAQGIFVNFANIQRTTRRKLPFGVCQVGKAFRNEITPGNFTFRTREFEQMECEFFCQPGTDLEWFAYWKDFCKNWLTVSGHQGREPAPAGSRACGAGLLFPRHHRHRVSRSPSAGWGELWGIADRTNYDLGRHQEASGKRSGPTSIRRRTSTIFPTSSSRLWAATVWRWRSCAKPTTRKWLAPTRRAMPTCAPCCVCIRRWRPSSAAILPLSKKLGPKAAGDLSASCARTSWWTMTTPVPSASATAGKTRSARPCCVTVDFQTVGDENTPADNCVTVRDRDTMEQVRIPIAELKNYIAEKCAF